MSRVHDVSKNAVAATTRRPSSSAERAMVAMSSLWNVVAMMPGDYAVRATPATAPKTIRATPTERESFLITASATVANDMPLH